MGLANVFDIAGSAMSAQTIRLNTVASNIANAETVAATPQSAYRAQSPVFKAVIDNAFEDNFRQAAPFDPESIFNDATQQASVATGGVSVEGIYQSDAEPAKSYNPSHPLADDEGYIYTSNVNIVDEMANMIAASRSFEMSAEVANTAKSMMQRLITLGS